MKLVLCIFVLLTLAGTAVSQTSTITCSECSDCPSNFGCPARSVCAIRFSLPSCTRVRAIPDPADLMFSGCVIVEADTVLRSITSNGAGSDCLMLGDNVRVLENIDLGGGNDYLVVGNNVRTGMVLMGDGRDCMTAGQRFRPTGIDLGGGNDQMELQDVNIQVDGTGMRQPILGGEGDDCMVIGPMAKKRSAADLDAIFANFDAGKRAAAGSESFMANIEGGAGSDCIKVDCVEARFIDGGTENDCLEATASRFHRMRGEQNSDVLRANDFDTVVYMGNIGGLFGGTESDTLEAAGSRTSPATMLDAGNDPLGGTIDRCCTNGPRVVSFNCEQPLAYPCVTVP